VQSQMSLIDVIELKIISVPWMQASSPTVIHTPP